MTANGRPASDHQVEERARALYSDWMIGGLSVVDDLVKEAGRVGSPTWPEVATSRALPTSSHGHGGAGMDPARRDDAIAKGWLVSVPESAAVCQNPAGRLADLAVVVKDIIDVAGLPTRNGTPGALWRHPERSAKAWHILEAEGALCLGKAATHEMAWGVTTPQIPHPADSSRVTGGSSGGSAACVAAGVSAAALGTDTGGSIRIPAALCGVVGLRPTLGAVSLEGITPLAPEQDVVGPLAQDVSTCAAMLEVLLGRPLPYAEHPPGGLRVGVLEQVGRLDPHVERAYLDSLDALRDAGAQIVPCDTSLHRSARSVSLLTMLVSSARAYAAAVRSEPQQFGGEARALLTLGGVIADRADDLGVARRVLRDATADLLSAQRLDAFVTPTCPCVAPHRHADTVAVGGREQPVAAALVAFTAWASAAGLPAVSVPVASSSLPVGTQVMAAPHREDVCLTLAGALERS